MLTSTPIVDKVCGTCVFYNAGVGGRGHCRDVLNQIAYPTDSCSYYKAKAATTQSPR